MQSSRKWTFFTVAMFYAILVTLGGITAVIDPFFHYHGPLSQLQYPIDNERYQNDGIVKHFNYDAVITGTSMTENFKTSQFDSVFGVNSIKVPFSGGYYKEVGDNLRRAIRYNPNIRCIIYGLYYNKILSDKNSKGNYTFPDYLYDERLANDVYYLLNKDVLINETLGVIAYTRSGQKTTDFDRYSNWMSSFSVGKAAVDKTYIRPDKRDSSTPFTEQDITTVKETISENITSLSFANPDITFYVFLTPYSIYYWDSLNQK